jgi:nucleoside 2-deoxyribosyltransferase
MRTLKVYIAGKVKPREMPLIAGIEWINPYVEELTEADVDLYAPRDLVLLRVSDVVLALFTTSKEMNTCTEVGVAYERGIPVIAVADPKVADRYRFTLNMCTSVFISEADAVRAVRLLVP